MESFNRTGYAYIRVSTDKQEELSPDAQLRLIKEYAQKNHILITEIFMENGISGRTAAKRPQFQAMISKAKEESNEINTILVWKFSRFARNQEESIVYKSLLKKQRNIDVISISEPLIEGPFGSLIERIIEWMDEYYSIRLSGEVLRGMTEKALRGGYQARPPFGYRMATGEVPTVHPKEATAVRSIFEKYTLENMSATDVTRWLNDAGFRTTRGNLFDSRGIRYMLENPFYAGIVRWNYSNRGREQKNQDEWIIVPGEHEAIISEELWEATKEALKKRIRPVRQRSVSTCKHWLSGVLVCSDCGRTLAYNANKSNGGKYTGFQCWGYAKGFCKHSHSIPEKKAVVGVIDGLETYLQSDGFTYTLLETATAQAPDKKIIILEKLDEVTKKEVRIKEAYRNGIDTLEEYKANKEILLAERNALQTELDKMNEMPVQQPQVIDEKVIIQSVNDVIELLKNEHLDPVKKGNALRSICHKIIYDKENAHMDFDIKISL